MSRKRANPKEIPKETVSAERSKAEHEWAGALLEIENELRDAYSSYVAAREAAERSTTCALRPGADSHLSVVSLPRAGPRDSNPMR